MELRERKREILQEISTNLQKPNSNKSIAQKTFSRFNLNISKRRILILFQILFALYVYKSPIFILNLDKPLNSNYLE